MLKIILTRLDSPVSASADEITHVVWLIDLQSADPVRSEVLRIDGNL